jgi:uncharacterized membrane protein YraQ (UPF0718 family)
MTRRQHHLVLALLAASAATSLAILTALVVAASHATHLTPARIVVGVVVAVVAGLVLDEAAAEVEWRWGR